ncbi:hypothetical protein OIU83_01010 [Flavobacterium sp. LS1R49]|uniref:Uncharacterized protein n=1 Tax=Flavobacterium shii TaxID=2987687 RepID=A0A9X3BWX0_9FLAO|nr:hypothetical protein [Flavobacterium shii]MCV9926215.1 hypothetical protein [Flavobacterium shii]
MKQKLLLVLLLSVHLVFSQEIKVKKGEILLDAKVIAKMEGKLGNYKITNLDGTTSISAKLKKCTENGFAFIEVLNDKNTNYLDFEKFSPFNVDRSIVQSLMSKKIITDQGIDINKLEEFFGVPSNLLEKYGCLQAEAGNKIATTLNIKINNAGEITKGGDSELIGNIARKIYTSQGDFLNYQYEVFDLDKKTVGKIETVIMGFGGVKELSTFDKKIVKVDIEKIASNIAIDKDPNAMKIVINLLSNGYELGHQVNAVNEANKEVIREKYKEALKNSINLTDVNGYVIDADGKHVSGQISSSFEEIKNPLVNNDNSNYAYGKEVSVKYFDENKKLEWKKYFSKNNIRFAVNKTGVEESYLGLYAKGETTSILDYSMFYKVLYEKDGYLILKDPKTENKYVIKFPNQEKGLYVTDYKKADKLKKNFTEYVDCPSIVFENYELNSIDGLKKLIGDVEVNCKK